MEFFRNLIRRSSTVNAADRPAAAGAQSKQAPTAQHRLGQFKAVYNGLLSLWKNGQGVSRDAFVAEKVRVHVVRLGQILNADIRGPTPHLVVSFAFTNGVLRTLVRIAAAFVETGIASETLGALQLVVDNEEEAFLEDRGLADALPAFVEIVKKDILGRQWGDKEEQVEKIMDKEVGLEARLAEVLFGIASAIRNRHLVLKAWFRPEQVYADEDELAEEELQTRKEDFPLFYMLLEDVAANGRVGDFSRMGLLYIVEATSYSSRLERWLIEGDMADMLASNLGALYSQLSRKLLMAHVEGEEPLLCKYGTNRITNSVPFDVEVMGSGPYQEHIRTFMASLGFWQDMLNHSPFDNVRKILLDHFQFLFLQQLLYPSLLESSDADGGSSVAVTTYLRNILQELDHPEMVNRTLCYLFGLPINEVDSSEPTSSTTKARRRKSENLFARKIDEEDKPSPELFNLSDLINNGLRSRSQPTVIVTLRLLYTLLNRQHQQALPHLLRTRTARMTDVLRSLGGHLKEVDTWLTLSNNITSSQQVEESYERALYDSQNMLEMHACTYKIKGIQIPGGRENFYALPLSPYIVLKEDPISKSLVLLLDGFLYNDIETNLDLTKVILEIISCPHMRLEGWLLTHPHRYIYRKPDGTPQTPKVEKAHEYDDDEKKPDDDAIEDSSDEENKTPAEDPLPPAREEPAWRVEDSSPIFQSLDRLVAKVESFHRHLHDFDSLLEECRKQITSPTATSMHKRQASPLPPPPDENGSATPTTASKPTVSTPVRGHARKTSLADRISSAFGTSPRQGELSQPGSPDTASLTERLGLRLSEASGARPSTSGKPSQAASSPSPHASPRKDRKGGKAPVASPVTPLRPSHVRHRSLRGEDLLASPSPRLDRRVVPGSSTEQDEENSLKQAIGNESDEDDEDEEDDDLDNGSEEQSRTGKGVHRNDDIYSNGDLDERDTDLDGSEGEANGQMNELERPHERNITVGHLLTNIVILQEFILEVAGMITVRGSTFGEVRFR